MNRYLEKVAGDMKDLWLGGASHAERRIAAKYGKEGPEESLAGDLKRDTLYGFRNMGRSLAHAMPGAAAGAYAGLKASPLLSKAKISHNPITNAVAGGAVGYLGGMSYGAYTGYKKKVQELHDKYREKTAANNELRDTAVIGALGTGSSLLTNHLGNRLGLNGAVAEAATTHTTPFLNRAKQFLKNPGPALRSPSFRNTLKIGAIGGAVGLVGDYAAVKINKALQKQASNIYLGKAADMYSEL